MIENDENSACDLPSSKKTEVIVPSGELLEIVNSTVLVVVLTNALKPAGVPGQLVELSVTHEKLSGSAPAIIPKDTTNMDAATVGLFETLGFI
jgi:hypothetical protein